MSPKLRKVSITLPRFAAAAVPIVATSAIAIQTVGAGRLIPLLIVDTSGRPDINELVRAHDYLAPGDVDTTWMHNLGKARHKSVCLMCEFHRPVKCVIILEFEFPRKLPVVDLIVYSGAMYLQIGKPGDKFDVNIDKPRILADVPSDSFREQWHALMSKVVERDLRNDGLSRRQARVAAADIIRRGRELWASSRVPESPNNEA